MNYTPLDNAYQIHHVQQGTYGGTIRYDPTCIFCKNSTSVSLMATDGGSFRQCTKCRKHFRAKVVNEAISNFSYSTHHLKGTN
jgi:hypothetical protein